MGKGFLNNINETSIQVPRFALPILGQEGSPPPPHRLRPPRPGLLSPTQQSGEPRKKFNPEKAKERVTRTLRTRVLWGFPGLGAKGQSAGVAAGNSAAPRHSQRPATRSAPGAAASAGTFYAAGTRSGVLPVGYLRPALGAAGRRDFCGPFSRAPDSALAPQGSHLPLISCIGASFLLKPFDT